MKDTYSYIAILDFAEDGISIEFPDLPGCLPCAQTQEEALRNAEEAMGLHLYGMEADGEEIPESTPISKIHLEKNQVPALISVYMPLVRQQVKNVSVKKTLTIPAWLNSAAERKNVNFSQVLQSALKQTLGLDDQPRV